MENVFRGQPGGNLTLEHIERATNLLLHGVGMACELQTTLMAILNLHGKLSVPLTKYVCNLVLITFAESVQFFSFPNMLYVVE